MKGDPAGAIVDFDQSIQLRSDNSDAYLDRAYAQYATNHLTEAQADFQKALDLKSSDPNYPRFFICLIKMNNPDLKAGGIKELSDYLSALPSDAAPWPLQVGQFLTGKLAESDFLNAANSSDATQNTNQHCEAYFYIGSMHELAGDKAGALSFYQKSVGTNVRSYPEYQISQDKIAAAK
jgi:lipoprotein NlpI